MNTAPLFDRIGPEQSIKRYTHECESCIFLGQYERYDLYVCIQDGKPYAYHVQFGDGIANGVTVCIQMSHALTGAFMIASIRYEYSALIPLHEDEADMEFI